MLKIVFQNEHAVVVDKAAGWLSRPSRLGPRDERPIASVQAVKQFGEIWIVHRLDFEVSGLLIFARNKEAHRLLNGVFERHLARKTYQALAPAGAGAPPLGEPQTWESKIAEGKKRSFFAEHGKPAKTLATLRSFLEDPERGRLGVWELEPVTGRRHQLRVEMASRGFLIVGDTLYGGKPPRWNGGIALRGIRLRIEDAPVREKLGLPEAFEAEDLVATP